jgi:hypothetical protein
MGLFKKLAGIFGIREKSFPEKKTGPPRTSGVKKKTGPVQPRVSEVRGRVRNPFGTGRGQLTVTVTSIHGRESGIIVTIVSDSDASLPQLGSQARVTQSSDGVVKVRLDAGGR